jgi:hypothetical protein
MVSVVVSKDNEETGRGTRAMLLIFLAAGILYYLHGCQSFDSHTQKR